MENEEVGGFDADFLLEWTNEEVSVKHVALITGVSIDTVYAYRDGRFRIPMSFWRTLFAATGDFRIAHLILGDTQYELLMTDRLPDLGSDAALFQQAMESLEKFHAEQKYFAEIAKDGRIDETDRHALRMYRQNFLQFRMQHMAVFRAVNKIFEKSVTAAAQRRSP